MVLRWNKLFKRVLRANSLALIRSLSEFSWALYFFYLVFLYVSLFLLIKNKVRKHNADWPLLSFTARRGRLHSEQKISFLSLIKKKKYLWTFTCVNSTKYRMCSIELLIMYQNIFLFLNSDPSWHTLQAESAFRKKNPAFSAASSKARVQGPQ